jgi:osmotically-inducible protein OsmY
VDTRDGVVTLTGEVESEAERRQAVALARNTDGVREVTDQLQVRPSESARGTTGSLEGAAREGGAAANDTWITTKIQSKYFLDNDVKGHEINVDSRNGVVTLKGTVESEAQKQMAAQIAQETGGVSRVVNELRVQAGSVPR